nr:extracellular solute-binding protein [Bradyrhizobium sp. 145]
MGGRKSFKPQVTQWIAETSQAISLIQTNELDCTIAPTNRVRSAQESGVSIDFSFDHCVRGTEYFCVLKGSKRKEAAMRFCEFVTRAPQQATMTVKTSIALSVREYDKLDEKVQRWIPDPNNPRNVITDDEYWADHFLELDKRFKEWILT